MLFGASHGFLIWFSPWFELLVVLLDLLGVFLTFICFVSILSLPLTSKPCFSDYTQVLFDLRRFSGLQAGISGVDYPEIPVGAEISGLNPGNFRPLESFHIYGARGGEQRIGSPLLPRAPHLSSRLERRRRRPPPLPPPDLLLLLPIFKDLARRTSPSLLDPMASGKILPPLSLP